MRLHTLLHLAALAAAPAALAQTPATPPAPVSVLAVTPAPFEGTWTYALDTPNGLLSGTFVFASAEGGEISGTMSNPMGPGSVPLSAFVRDGQALSFSFDSGDYGVLPVRLTFKDGTYEGTVSVMGMGLPITGARKTDG